MVVLAQNQALLHDQRFPPISEQDSLQAEKTAAVEARKAHLYVESTNKELVKKLEDAEQKVDQLQQSVQRSV